jgi:hypothetical protein
VVASSFLDGGDVGIVVAITVLGGGDDDVTSVTADHAALAVVVLGLGYLLGDAVPVGQVLHAVVAVQEVGGGVLGQVEVIVKKGAISASRPNQCATGEVFCNGSRGVIFAPHGKQWQKNRQVFSKVLTKHIGIRYAFIVENAAAQLCLNLLRFSEEAKEAGISSPIYTEHYTLNILIGGMFGEQRDMLNDPNYRAMLEANTETIRRINPNGFIMDFLPFLRLPKVIVEREAEPGLVIQPRSRRFCHASRTPDVGARLALRAAQTAAAL